MGEGFGGFFAGDGFAAAVGEGGDGGFELGEKLLGVGGGADAGPEHEVEVAGFGEFAAAVGAVGGFEVVFAEAAVAFATFGERVGEAGDVSAGAPDVGSHEDGGVESDDVVAAPDEGLPPGVFDVLLEFDAEGAIVPGAGESAVDFAALEDEASALAEGSELVEIYVVGLGLSHGAPLFGGF